MRLPFFPMTTASSTSQSTSCRERSSELPGSRAYSQAEGAVHRDSGSRSLNSGAWLWTHNYNHYAPDVVNEGGGVAPTVCQ